MGAAMNKLHPPYGAILADPPWRFALRSPKGAARSACNHYSTMSLNEIMALPVWDLAADDCVLFLWAVDPMLPQALRVIEAWGFEFKTVAFYWAKGSSSSSSVGLGYWTRGNPEICLLATRGRPKRQARDVRKLLVAPRREHSRKPDEIRTRIVRLVDGPYLELFAREATPGWDTYGDQLGIFDGGAR
jgi:N6-adenosine-specific RNA methylase IME4